MFCLLSKIFILVSLNPVSSASEFYDRAARANQAQSEQYAQEAVVRGQANDAYMYARVSTFGAKRGGATITSERRFDGNTSGAGTFGKSFNIIAVLEFSTGSGLACRAHAYEVVIDCFDQQNQRFLTRVGPAADQVEARQTPRRRAR
jgi:hypothetical protein